MDIDAQDVPETYLVHELFQRWRLQVWDGASGMTQEFLYYIILIDYFFSGYNFFLLILDL